jgi:hypothetical protein
MPFRRVIERDFPHIVETVVPERGLRSKRVAIMDFHARRGIRPYPSERCTDDCQYIRWHFADREIAEAFTEDGLRLAATMPLPSPAAAFEEARKIVDNKIEGPIRAGGGDSVSR